MPYIKSTAHVRTSGEQSITSISDLNLAFPTPVVRAVAKYLDLWRVTICDGATEFYLRHINDLFKRFYLKLKIRECALTVAPPQLILMSPPSLSKAVNWETNWDESNLMLILIEMVCNTYIFLVTIPLNIRKRSVRRQGCFRRGKLLRGGVLMVVYGTHTELISSFWITLVNFSVTVHEFLMSSRAI